MTEHKESIFIYKNWKIIKSSKNLRETFIFISKAIIHLFDLFYLIILYKL